MAGRTVQRWARWYQDGYDLSGYARSIGALNWSFDEADLTTLADSVKGYLPVLCNMSPASLDGNFDTTATSGLHAVASTPGSRVLTIPFGINAEPAQGDVCYVGRYQQAGYTAAEDGGAVVVNMPFDGWDAGNPLGFEIPWGVMLRPKTATTGANTAAGVESPTGGATAFGGYLVYQIFAAEGTSTMTATISVDKSTTTNVDGSFSALSGATTGSIACSTPTAGIVALAHDASIGRYLRWQIALGTATSVTFALAFVRAYH